MRLSRSRTKALKEALFTSRPVRLFHVSVCIDTYGNSLWPTRHRVHFYPCLSLLPSIFFSFLPTSFHITSVALETSDILTYESTPNSLTNRLSVLLLLSSHTSSPLRSVSAPSSGRPAICGSQRTLTLVQSSRACRCPTATHSLWVVKSCFDPGVWFTPCSLSRVLSFQDKKKKTCKV